MKNNKDLESLNYGQVPIGTIVATVLSEKNIENYSGWLLCDGRDIDLKYSDLIKLIGPKTPELCGRTLVGHRDGEYELKQIGGEKEHTLTTNEIPSHTHALYFPKGDKKWNDGSGNSIWGEKSHKRTTTESGGGLPHNNMQPYYVVNFIIFAG